MRNGGKSLAMILCAALLPATAFAGSDSGPYIGAGVGQASVGDISDIGGQDLSFDGDDTGYKVFAGFNFGLIPLIDLAIEVGYVDFGKPDERQVEIEIDGWDAFGLIGGKLGPVGVFGKVGFISWDTDARVQGGASGGDDGTDPAYGLGARLKFGSLEVRAEYELFDIGGADDVSLLSASAAWTF
jgi:hypothetical protein